jgi:hypothetical protein
VLGAAEATGCVLLVLLLGLRLAVASAASYKGLLAWTSLLLAFTLELAASS